MNKTDKILVTGASGLIGSALVRLLKAEGYENVLTPSHKDLNLISPIVHKYFLNERPEYVFHLAAYVGGIQDNANNPAEFIYNNTQMHCNVIDACRSYGIKKLLFPGSACAYPRDAEQPIKESSFLQGIPESTNLAYALAKQNGIIMAQSYAKQYGMNVVLPMVTNTYGIGDISSHVIPETIKKFRESKNGLWFIGTGKPKREFIYADDVADAFLFLMENYNSSEIINVGTMEEILIFDLLNKISSMVKSNWNINFDSPKLDGAMRKCLDSSKLYEMGWKSKISLDEGLGRVIASL